MLIPAGQCIGCHEPLPEPFLDLGITPLANAYLDSPEATVPEPRYPLRVAYCRSCHLVQLYDRVPPEEMFSEYAYFSSYSETVVEHGRKMAAALTHRFGLNSDCTVLEIASNDGYLLRFFKEQGVPVLGVEPAANIARHALSVGIPTINAFFGPAIVPRIKEEFGLVNLIIGNNVLAHVPDIRPFLQAVKDCLKPEGSASFEFPYLRDLLKNCEFDTIYHEHVSYFSLSAIQKLAEATGLTFFDAELHAIHGGSVRVFLSPTPRPVTKQLRWLLEDEERLGLTKPGRFNEFQGQVARIKDGLLKKLHELKDMGKSVAAYGAPAKGNTLLNFCNIDSRLIQFTVDRSPHKQGRFLPGSRIPVLAPSALMTERPDFTVILPWNITTEIISQQHAYLASGGKFIIPIPMVQIVSEPEASRKASV